MTVWVLTKQYSSDNETVVLSVHNSIGGAIDARGRAIAQSHADGKVVYANRNNDEDEDDDHAHDWDHSYDIEATEVQP